MIYNKNVTKVVRLKGTALYECTKTGPNSRTYSNIIVNNHAEPLIAGSGLDQPHQALKVRHEHRPLPRPPTMVDTRSLVLIDDGIDIDVLIGDWHRLELPPISRTQWMDCRVGTGVGPRV